MTCYKKITGFFNFGVGIFKIDVNKVVGGKNMNNLIDVDPSRLEDTATRVESADLDYQRLYASLYSEVDRLDGNWGGKDNKAFSGKIRSYEEDFRQISIIMRQYSEFLRASARAYRETQEELANCANRLRGSHG